MFKTNEFKAKVRREYGYGTARSVTRFFDTMQVRLPQDESEYLETSDGGYLIFLKDANCTIRISRDSDTPLIEHPRILGPLGSKQIGPLRIDIYPGIHATVDKNDAADLFWDLDRDKIHFWDTEVENAGYIPGTKDEYGRKFAVILDAGAISRISPENMDLLNERVKEAKRILGDALSDYIPDTRNGFEIQLEQYGELRALFNEAWEDDKPNTLKITEFWNQCALMKERGLLVNGWDTNEDIQDVQSYNGLKL